MDRHSLERIKQISQRRRKEIHKTYTVKGRRRRTLQFLQPELQCYAYQSESGGAGAPTITVNVTNRGGAPSHNTVVKLFLPNGRIAQQRVSVQSGQTKRVPLPWQGNPLPPDSVEPYHVLCFDPLHDPIGGGFAARAKPRLPNFVRGLFPERPPLSLQILDVRRLEETMLSNFRCQIAPPDTPSLQQIRTNLQTLLSQGIPEEIPEALAWLKDWMSPWQWKPVGSTTVLSHSIVICYDWNDIRAHYEQYSDLSDWTAHSPTTSAPLPSPNGWRAQSDTTLAGVCIATTALTPPQSDLRQELTVDDQTIGQAARGFMRRGDLLATLSAAVRVEDAATVAEAGLDCLDGGGALLTTLRTSSPPLADQWFRVAASTALPPNTARLRLRLTCDKSNTAPPGGNAVFGDLALTLTHRQAYFGTVRT